jgi:hypothetical protein
VFIYFRVFYFIIIIFFSIIKWQDEALNVQENPNIVNIVEQVEKANEDLDEQSVNQLLVVKEVLNVPAKNENIAENIDLEHLDLDHPIHCYQCKAHTCKSPCV